MAVRKLSIVKMSKERHSAIKLFAVKADRKMYEVVDVACKQYLERQAQAKKGGDSKEK